jgi:hypothetical protein
MSTQHEVAEDLSFIVTREFVGRREETDDTTSTLSAESQAGLRQFSLERMLGYGVDYADAVELRGRVLDGQDWHTAATALADACLRRTQGAPETAGRPTRITYLRRASALLRMSQMTMNARRMRDLIAPWVEVSNDGDLEVIRQAQYTFRARVADRWRRGRVFLLGDAAHLTPPFIGQGLCAGNARRVQPHVEDQPCPPTERR